MTALTPRQAEWRARACGRRTPRCCASPPGATRCSTRRPCPGPTWGCRTRGASGSAPATRRPPQTTPRPRSPGAGAAIWGTAGSSAGRPRADDWPGLVVGDGGGVFATDATVAAAFPLVVPDGVTLSHEPSLEDGAGGVRRMDGRPPAREPAGVGRGPRAPQPRVRGSRTSTASRWAVRCVWWAEGTAYLWGSGCWRACADAAWARRSPRPRRMWAPRGRASTSCGCSRRRRARRSKRPAVGFILLVDREVLLRRR